MKYSLNYQTNQNKNQNCVIAQNIQYNSARQSTNSNIKHFDLNLKQTSNTNPSSNMNTNQNFNINPLSNINPNNNHNINPIIYNAPIVKNNHVTTSDDKMTFGSFLSHCSVSP